MVLIDHHSKVVFLVTSSMNQNKYTGKGGGAADMPATRAQRVSHERSVCCAAQRLGSRSDASVYKQQTVLTSKHKIIVTLNA